MGAAIAEFKRSGMAEILCNPLLLAPLQFQQHMLIGREVKEEGALYIGIHITSVLGTVDLLSDQDDDRVFLALVEWMSL
jgi:hypothetical protein